MVPDRAPKSASHAAPQYRAPVEPSPALRPISDKLESVLDASSDAETARALMDAVDEACFLGVARSLGGSGASLDDFSTALLECAIHGFFGNSPAWTKGASRVLAEKLSPLVLQDATCRMRLAAWREELEKKVARDGSGT